MAVVVRKATAADLPRLVELLGQLAFDPAQEQSPGEALIPEYEKAFAAIEADERQQLLVVEDDGRVMGTAAVVFVPNLTHRGQPYAIVENVVVDGAARGQGYGAVLMRHAIDLARTAGCFKVALTSNVRRTEAHRFYERLGFVFSHRGYRIDF